MGETLCVVCGQKLPSVSKLTRREILVEEAEEKGWHGESSAELERGGVIEVQMCMQCQIDRAEALKGRR